MKQATLYLFVLLAPAFTACRQDTDVDPDTEVVLVNSDFSSGTDGWTGGFTDYSIHQEGLMNFRFEHTTLPAPLNTNEKALLLSGKNASANMFMFVKRKISGLQPNTSYTLLFELEMASQYANNSVGIGGSPATSVYVKVGATPTEPVKVRNGDFYNLSIDKGNQSNRGRDMIVIGHVGAGDDVNEYRLIQRSNQGLPFTAITNDKGELWVIVGTDSGFEGITSLYYNTISITAL
ncbi:hypothetical protein GCM10023187_22310 [Nibrella viscosa]|uniref:Lipoprotein n=1 Tax=Nibrella viscosa TaxID=1084524 RepID=A0ABP8KE32_9BACT